MSPIVKTTLRSLCVLFAVLPFHTALADTTVSGTITDNVTWTPAEGPYVVSYVSIPSDASLTILPGTVVKVYDGGNAFTVDGSLTVGANGAAPVIITSLRDDSIGGDTNKDGAVTTPAAGDWRSIIVNQGAHATFTNTLIRYGGQTFPISGSSILFHIFKNNGGNLTLDHDTIAHSTNNAIYQTAGTTTLTNSAIDNATNGIYADGGAVELSDNTFTHLSYYAVAITGAAQLKNNAGNSGTGGIYLDTFTGATTLPADTLPYLLGSPTLPSGAALTILPGAIVKFLNDSGLTVEGTLTVGANGRAPVIITSYRDDTVLGDTNGDGTSTTAHPGDWRSITVHTGGEASFTNTLIRYGGGYVSCFCGGVTGLPLIQNKGGTLTLDHATLALSGNDALVQTAGAATVLSSTIDNADYGLRISGGSLAIGDDTFTHLAYDAVTVTGTTGFVNYGNNHGEGGISVSAIAAGDRKSTRLNSSHIQKSRMPSSA